MASCARCGRLFDHPPGRGGRSPYCPECKAVRRAAQQQQRSLRHALATVSEWIDALGPTVIEWKAEVVTRQDGKCARCGRSARLYLGRDEIGLVGLCLPDHEKWREERSRSDDRDVDGERDGARDRGDPAGVPG